MKTRAINFAPGCQQAVPQQPRAAGPGCSALAPSAAPLQHSEGPFWRFRSSSKDSHLHKGGPL